VAFTPTQAQIDYWLLARDICVQLQIPKGTFQHRNPEGVVTTTGGTGAGRNKRYIAPQDRQVPSVVEYQAWIIWKEMQMRGGTASAGDGSEGEIWMERAVGQMPAIDVADDGTATLIPMQDEDWIVGSDGQSIFKVENPIMSVDQAYWSFMMVVQR
jgi:hypothetical protein